tara:strand:- start:371 stop:592 length:222 start_codon:yes stop_codon:yes gene_type:complete
MASQKKLKKFGKKMRKQRERDLNNMKNRLSEIADSEKKRSQEIFESHQEFFQTTKTEQPKVEIVERSIDFYEK